MKQVLLKSYKTLEILDTQKPVPGKGEVLIRVSHVGICGSDISAFYGKHPYIPFPMVLGHEFTGYVEAAGPDTAAPKPGTRVTVLPHLPCKKDTCMACSQEHYNRCKDLKVLGCQSYGAFSEYVTAPAEMVFPLPEGISMEQGAAIEPMAVSYAGVRKAVHGGENVLVAGAGTIGLFAMQAAKVLGAKKVAIADFAPNRLEVAKGLGADAVFCLSKKDLSQWTAGFEEQEGNLNVFCDCVGGNGAALDSIIQSAGRGADVVCIGVLTRDCQIPHLPDITEHELTFHGSNMYIKQDYADIIRYLNEGKMNTTGMITHTYSLEELPKAYEMIDKKEEPFIKIMITV